jgi:transcriptional regulator with XRE-family HTH domain
MSKAVPSMPGSAPRGFAERLVLAREAAGLRQVDLADAIGVRAQTQYRFERKGHFPSRPTLLRMLQVLDVTEAWLVQGLGPGPGAPRLSSAIDAYLRSQLGADTPPDVASALRDVPQSVYGMPTPNARSIHRVREAIEMNLAFARQHTDGADRR